MRVYVLSVLFHCLLINEFKYFEEVYSLGGGKLSNSSFFFVAGGGALGFLGRLVFF